MRPKARRRSGSWAHTERGAASQQTALPEWEQEWREAAAADRAEQVRAPQRTVRHRLLALLPPAVLAAAAPTVLSWTPGFSTGNTRAAIIASAVAAVVAVSIVPLANRLGAALTDSGAGDRLLFIAALASAGAAAIHFSVIKMHFDEYTLYGVFFVACGLAQLVWPVWLLIRRWPPLLVLGALGNAAIAALWIVDRAGWVPLGPDATKPPPFGFADSVASGFEVLLVVACLVALLRGRGRPLRPGANLALTLGTAALTTLAFLSVLGVGSSILPPAK
jgi:hypothetical protein